MTTRLRNDDNGKQPALNICHPSHTCLVANVEKHEGKGQTDVTFIEDFMKFKIKSNETKPVHSETFCPKVKELEDISYNDDGTPESTLTININSSTFRDSWKHDLAKCLAISTTLTTLHLTINDHSSMFEDFWGRGLADGLAESTTLTTLHLTLNDHSSTLGNFWFWPRDLGKGLAKSTTLTTLHLTLNNHSSTLGNFCARGLADGLAKSTTLTTLHLTLNDHSSTLGNFWARDLADGLAKSTTLTTLHLTLNNHSSTLGNFWARGLADGLAKSTTLTTLHLTLNDHSSTLGNFWARDLADGLPEGLATLRKSLTTFRLIVNHHDATDETTGSTNPSDSSTLGNFWARDLADGLAKSTTLTTLHLTLNDHSSTLGNFWARDLADGLAKSTTLTTFHLVINDVSMCNYRKKCLAEGLATLRKSLTTLRLIVNHHDATDETTGSTNPSRAIETSLRSYDRTTMDNVMIKYSQRYPAHSPAKLRKSLPALNNSVNYNNPLDWTSDDNLKSMLSTTAQ